MSVEQTGELAVIERVLQANTRKRTKKKTRKSGRTSI
jgi:hypothetical protein